ncbi:sequence-specific DNA binding transcription factors [Striga asiatica]|uniref:Sequence-specific DNA binding transcription factors n=1 Tax=Striga asiatica TaxID=4170 RepID=A0A5A7Q7D8_STRAF|nr:sequence-specific DNA binding transcription factors [Striga asiatica]
MDIDSENAVVLLLVEEIINLRNLFFIIAYLYLKLVVQPRQIRRRRGRLGNASYFTDSCTDWRWRWFKLGMESTGSGGRNSQPSGQRRVWNADEEKALINGLRDLVTRGWKCDNGFRNGYTTILEQHMRQQFPGTTIKAEPHISSKITVWKKNYGIVSDMLGSTGFGWNEMGKMVTVRDDTVWDSYIKAHPKAKSMRYKSWPLYADWVEIFGKDRATGEGAQGFTDAVNDVLHDTNVEEPSPVPTEDQFPEQCDYPQTNFDSFSAQAGESSASGKSKRDGKRKRNVEPEDKIIGFLSSVCQETNNRLSELSTRVGYQANAKQQRIAVYDALKKIPHLTTDERVGVARYLSKNPDEMDLFFSLDDDAKTSMVHQILSGPMLEGWTEGEEKVCYRLFFQKCSETEDVDRAPVLNSLWFGISRQLSELMQKDFTWEKVREKIHCLQGHYRLFLRYMTTPGVRVHDDGGLVSVNRDYWNVVGETDLQVFFRSNGFKWYNHCLQLWNVRGAADVDLESNPGANNDYPICLDDTMSDVWSEDGMEDEVEVQQDVAGQIHENPLWVDPLNDVQADEDIMDHESDVDSCVDSV